MLKKLARKKPQFIGCPCFKERTDSSMFNFKCEQKPQICEYQRWVKANTGYYRVLGCLISDMKVWAKEVLKKRKLLNAIEEL